MNKEKNLKKLPASKQAKCKFDVPKKRKNRNCYITLIKMSHPSSKNSVSQQEDRQTSFELQALAMS